MALAPQAPPAAGAFGAMLQNPPTTDPQEQLLAIEALMNEAEVGGKLGTQVP
jgi:hypothetical protein